MERQASRANRSNTSDSGAFEHALEERNRARATLFMGFYIMSRGREVRSVYQGPPSSFASTAAAVGGSTLIDCGVPVERPQVESDIVTTQRGRSVNKIRPRSDSGAGGHSGIPQYSCRVHEKVVLQGNQ